MAASIAQAAALMLMSLVSVRAQVAPIRGGGVFGGQLRVPIASAPQTFNPVFGTDASAKLIASLTQADLMHINPRTLAVEPALATAVEHRTPTRWIVHLRRGVRFSDGEPFTAQDVAFSFRVYTDEKLDPPGRELLTVNGKPITCKVVDETTVEMDLPAPLAVGDRVFDSVWMLPRHKLASAYEAGKFEHAWDSGTALGELTGLGPFRVAGLQPGQEIRLERNPQFWRSDAQGRRLPFLDSIVLPEIADSNLRLTMFLRGQLDGLPQINSGDAARLGRLDCCRVLDAGAGLNPEMLVLNQAPGGDAARDWFREVLFRRAISLAVDRDNLVRNVYGGKARALASLTSPSAGQWVDPTPPPRQNLEQARRLLQQAGFQWRAGRWYDHAGHAVEFSLIYPSSNADRGRIAVFLQEDLRKLGIAVQVTPLDFNSYLDRLAHRRDFQAALLGLSIPDADPNVEGSEWSLDGGAHFWNLAPQHPSAWGRQLDTLFRRQLTSTDPEQRRRDYAALQAIEREQLPFIPLVAPDILAAARRTLQGAQAALLPPHLLWNADRLYWPVANH
ncbi:MAG TPA: ABC transporter substrate-binding protein [Terriglobales bacterium]